VARLVLLVSAVMVTLLIGLTLADNATRYPFANPPYSESWMDAPFRRDAPPMQAEPGPVRTAPATKAEHPGGH
jgi:hypothetical protein